MQMLRFNLGQPVVNPDPPFIASAKVGENLESQRVIEPNSATVRPAKQELCRARHSRARGLSGRGHAWPPLVSRAVLCPNQRDSRWGRQRTMGIAPLRFQLAVAPS